jgi:hypothetical protein
MPAPAGGVYESDTADVRRFGIDAGSFLVGFQNSVTGDDLGFYAARSYSLMRLPRTGRRWIRSWERSGTG